MRRCRGHSHSLETGAPNPRDGADRPAPRLPPRHRHHPLALESRLVFGARGRRLVQARSLQDHRTDARTAGHAIAAIGILPANLTIFGTNAGRSRSAASATGSAATAATAAAAAVAAPATAVGWARNRAAANRRARFPMTESSGATITVDRATATARHTRTTVETMQPAFGIRNARRVVATIAGGGAYVTAGMARPHPQAARNAECIELAHQ